MLKLELEMTYHLTIKGPLARTTGAPLGEREYWEMSAGELVGPRIKARIVAPGGDWMRVGSDGMYRPDVRTQLQSDDGAIILLHYTGLVKPNAVFSSAAEQGKPTRFEDQYLRQVMTFETGSEKYRWMTQELFIAEGRLSGAAQIEYRIYRIG